MASSKRRKPLDRRSVSMPGPVFRRLRAFADSQATREQRAILRDRFGDEWRYRELSCAGLVTALVESLLDELGAPAGDPGPQRRGVGGRPSRLELAEADDGAAIFTF